MSSILDAFNSLQTEFNRVSKDLQSVEDNLKKLTGGQSSNLKRNLKRNAPDSEAVFLEGNVEEPPKRNKFIGKAFSRVHGPSWQPREPLGDNDDKEDQHHRPVLLSQVVPAVREVKSRNEALEEQPPDEKSKARNRRMFGIILGTLQKFQSEESQRKQTTKRREEIEEKLEKMAEKERNVIRKEKKELYKRRRESQAHLRRIELKMERVQVHQEWEKSYKTLVNFIQTKTKPHLFYLPKEHTTESEKRWKQTKDKYRLILAEKRAKVQKELSEIDEMYKKETEMDDDDEDRDDETNKSVEMDSQENTNNDAIELMDDSIDQDKVCNSKVNDSIENNQKSNVNETNNSNDKRDHEVDNGQNDDSNNHVANDNNKRDKNDSINHYNDNAKTVIEGSMETQLGDAGKSSSEQLTEKEFEPIYDDDE